MSIPRLEAVVIGASSGALDALSALLPSLPRDYPVPIFVVVHLPSGKPSSLVNIFRSKCQMLVCDPEDKEPIVPGCIYFAPPDYHLLVEGERLLSLSSEEPVLFSRPSIDVLFETAADAYREGLLGIILTGANEDGAKGLKAVLDQGGRGLIQQPDTAQAREMPRAALRLCPNVPALSLPQIALQLQQAVST